MSKKEKNDLELSLTDKIITLIIRGRWWLLGVFCLIAIVGIVLGVLSAVNSSNSKKNSTEFLPIESDFNSIRDLDDPDFSDVLNQLNEYISDSGSYTNLKTLYMRAYIYSHKGEYQNSLNDYKTVYNKAGKDSYYKDLALYGMAVSNEELGRTDEAKQMYQQLWDDYGKASPEASSALFALLRFAIGDNDVDKQDEYARLIRDNYAYSDYAKVSEQYIKEEVTETTETPSEETTTTTAESDSVSNEKSEN